MEWKLYRFMTPLGILAILFGLMMAATSSDLLVFFTQRWIITKLVVVLLLFVYQLYCWRIYKDLSSGNHKWTGFQLRVFNEAPVILLLIAIIAAVFKF